VLLALRSLYEQLTGGGDIPSVELDKFFRLKKKKKRPDDSVALALYASGQIDEYTFAALLAAEPD